LVDGEPQLFISKKDLQGFYLKHCQSSLQHVDVDMLLAEYSPKQLQRALSESTVMHHA
jgi:hypothetical protein